MKNRDDLLKQAPKLPDELKDYIHDEIRQHYMTYRRVKAGELDDSGFYRFPSGWAVECSACQVKTFIEKKDVLFIHKEEAVCPNCGMLVISLAEGRGRKNIRDRYCLMTFVPESFNRVWVLCLDYAFFDYTDITEAKSNCKVFELILLTPEGFHHWHKQNFYGLKKPKFIEFANPHDPRLKFQQNCGLPINIEFDYVNYESIFDTFLKYSAVDEYMKVPVLSEYNLSLIKYLENYCMYPCLEYITKAGFINLATSLVENGKKGKGLLNWKAKTFTEFFKISKADIKILQGFNPNSDEAGLFVRLFRKYPKLCREKIMTLMHCAEDVEMFFAFISELKTTPEKILNYLFKKRATASFQDYRDYVAEIIQLEYPLDDEDVIFPSDFLKAHRRTSKLILHKANKELDKKVMKRKEKLEFVCLANSRYIVSAPESATDIIFEGKELKHCVGSYVDSHIAATTNILFLRYKRKPGKPFYTIEVDKSGKVKQCRGMKNCGQTKKVKEFMETFEKHAIKAFKKNKKTKSSPQKAAV